MTGQKHNLQELFSTVKDYFSPKIVGEVNDAYIKIVKVKGQDVPWHTHDNEDELFFLIQGNLTIEMRDCKDIHLEEGELFIVKRGIEHKVHSKEECRLMLVENKTTKHTGDVQSHITKTIREQKY